MDVVATETSILLGLHKDDALRYGYDDPRFLRFLLSYMSAKLHGRGYAVMSSTLPLVNRVVLYLFGQAIENDNISVESKTEVADLLGTTTRHLNRIIKSLEDDDVIHWQKNRVIVKDMQKLQSYGEL